ncbi:MAG: M48 family metalloprotease, partial [Elusimicrobiota bacterium]
MKGFRSMAALAVLLSLPASLRAGWTFSYSLTLEGACGGVSVPALPPIPALIPDQGTCNALRAQIDAISETSCGPDGCCTAGYAVGACVFQAGGGGGSSGLGGVNIPGAEFLPPGYLLRDSPYEHLAGGFHSLGDISLSGLGYGDSFFTPHYTHSTDDWIAAAMRRWNSYLETNRRLRERFGGKDLPSPYGAGLRPSPATTEAFEKAYLKLAAKAQPEPTPRGAGGLSPNAVPIDLKAFDPSSSLQINDVPAPELPDPGLGRRLKDALQSWWDDIVLNEALHDPNNPVRIYVNPEMQGRLQNLLDGLSRGKDRNFEIVLVDKGAVVNAAFVTDYTEHLGPFAYAHGSNLVFVERHYMEQNPSREELAFVLAHEMGHTEKEHPWEDVVVIKYRVGDAVTQDEFDAFRRTTEMEADAVAAQTVFNAGMDARGIMDFLRRENAAEQARIAAGATPEDQAAIREDLHHGD